MLQIIKCQLYYCKSLGNCSDPPKFTIVNMMYICKYRQFTIVKYCCVRLSLIKFFFYLFGLVCLWFWVVPLFMAVAPLPRLVFGRGLPVSAAAARPAPLIAPRPAQPRAAAGFSLSSWGSVLFVLFCLFRRPPKAAAGGCRPSGRRPSVVAPAYPRKVLRGQICPLRCDFFFSGAVSEAFAPSAPVSV